MTTTVINIKSGQSYDIYIGRANGSLPASKWHNPMRLKHEEDRPLLLTRYRLWILSQPRLLADIGELRGKALACWCSPLGCHGDILAELADAPERERSARTPPVWALESIREYWQTEAALGSVALERLQTICKQNGWSYDATLEALR